MLNPYKQISLKDVKKEIKMKSQDDNFQNDATIILQDTIEDHITCEYPWNETQVNQSAFDLDNDIIITNQEHYMPNLGDLLKTESIVSVLDDVVAFCQAFKLTDTGMHQLEKYKLRLPTMIRN
eukprot:189316_1